MRHVAAVGKVGLEGMRKDGKLTKYKTKLAAMME